MSSNLIFRILFFYIFLIIFVLGDKWSPDFLEEDIYYSAYGEAKCVRLSTKYNRTGCATLPDGQEARLRYVSNESDIELLITDNQDPYKHDTPIAIVMSLDLISSQVVTRIANAVPMAKGIIFVQDDNTGEELKPPSDRSGYSPDSNSPMYYLKPPNHSNVYIWNPLGSFLMFEQFPFAIIVLSKSQSSKIKSWAEENEQLINEGKFAYRYVEFTYEMFAKNTSVDCLKDDTCLPVGGYSVWTSFEKINSTSNNDTSNSKDYVFGITSMDTTAMFHQNVCRGSDANQSGLVALLAALSALSGIKDIIYNLPKQIVIAAFQGEAYDLVGSRKFVYDITNKFDCVKPMTSYRDGGCWQPFMSSLDFTKIDFSKISSVVELQQVGIKVENKPRQLFAHYERGVSDISNQSTQTLIQDIISIAQNIANESNQQFVVSKASDPSLPGTPPSSFWSYLHVNNNLPGVVLTDFETEYTNTWYHSVFDSIYQIDANQVCMTATLFARTLLTMADTEKSLNTSFMRQYVNADCILVETLINCLMQDMSCDLVSSVAPSASDPTPTHYSSVYQIIEDQSVSGTSQFLFRYMANLTRIGSLHATCEQQNECFDQNQVCAGTYDGTYCVDSSTYYHPAVEPELNFNYDTQLFEVPDVANLSGLLWTESTWPSKIGTRFYVKESNDAIITMVVCGVVGFVFALIVTWRLQSYCQTQFKVLS